MIWRGRTDTRHRILACLMYLIPLVEVSIFGLLVFRLLPPLKLVFLPIFAIAPIYFYPVAGLPLVAIAIFFALYFFIVRNRWLPHFLRYNTIQALLLTMFSTLCRLALGLLDLSQPLLDPLSPLLGIDREVKTYLPLEVLITVIFLYIAGSSFYAIFQCIRGFYPEIPVVYNPAYQQVQD